MSIAVRPATQARFSDVATMLGPKNPDSSVCWCLSHRLDSKTNRALAGRARGEYVKMLCGRQIAPGVLAYAGAEVAGWAAVAPRSELPFARSAKIPHVDDLPVWSVWCIRVRPGYRGRGISHTLLEGAVTPAVGTTSASPPRITEPMAELVSASQAAIASRGARSVHPARTSCEAPAVSSSPV